MASSWGNSLRLSVFGESHGPGVGVVLDGLPHGVAIDYDELCAEMQKRAPGQSDTATARREPDEPEILSGLLGGVTTGAPLAALIRNRNQRSADYQNLLQVPRPSHSDYPAYLRYDGQSDTRGGGHFSGRLTAPLVFAGAVCHQILRERGIRSGAHILAVGELRDAAFDPVAVDDAVLAQLEGASFPTLSREAGEAMRAAILAAKGERDSLGGVVECCMLGLPAGMGTHMFGGVENRFASLLFGIPAVRGVSFGAGFDAARMTGRQYNDPYTWEDGRVTCPTNHSGGVLGGMTTGMPLLFQVAFKPTPSIAAAQQSVDLSSGEAVELVIKGRHDPCVVPRAVPVVRACAAIAALDMLLERDGYRGR